MLVIGSDHTGIDLKRNIIDYLNKNNVDYIDETNFENQEGDDYPDIAEAICEEVLKSKGNLGVAICGTGIGISISCNKIYGIRAALCVDSQMAEMSKRHNNANVLCLGARLKYSQNISEVQKMIDLFLNTKFEGGRHERRIEKIVELEKSGRKYKHDN